jgi:hypothetical protein
MMRFSSRMTLEQLKRHVNRRLLKKADKSDLRRLEPKIDTRLAVVDARLEYLDRQLRRFNRSFNERVEGQRRILDEFQSRLTDLESHHG